MTIVALFEERERGKEINLGVFAPKLDSIAMNCNCSFLCEIGQLIIFQCCNNCFPCVPPDEGCRAVRAQHGGRAQSVHLKRVGGVKVGLEHGDGAEASVGQVGHGGRTDTSAKVAHVST